MGNATILFGINTNIIEYNEDFSTYTYVRYAMPISTIDTGDLHVCVCMFKGL